MNPRDEKILLTIKKNQLDDYGNMVPFCVIQRNMPGIDGTELTIDLHNLVDDNYLAKIDDPVKQLGWWYCLTTQGRRECDRIKLNEAKEKKNRRNLILSSILSAIAGSLITFALCRLF